MNHASPSSLEIDCQSVKAKLDAEDNFVLLDCRENDEHQLVNIPQADFIPMSEIQERIAELKPHQQREIIVLCHHGMRSMQVTQWLIQQGFVSVKSMAGGIDHWAQTIDPTLPRY